LHIIAACAKIILEAAEMRKAIEIIVNVADRGKLEALARGRKTTVRLAQRAKIVLRAADRMTNKQIATELGTDRQTADRWRRRFSEGGLQALEKDLPRGGRPSDLRDAKAALIIEKTTQSKPQHATHWSARSLAKELNLSHSMVHRVWKAAGLKPHLARNFKLSKDKRFLEKLVDVVGLYLNPPENALVLCADEKSQIQALNRTQPSLPMKRGRCGTMTHDYKRNGTTTLFAAIELAKGTLIGSCMPRHRHLEWIKFLKQIDSEMPKEMDLHLIVDNYSTHKHAKVSAWLSRHPRFHIHFVPTSSSWLNLIERWFGIITDKLIRRGTYFDVQSLIDDIMSFMANHNQNPETFVWTAKVDDILKKVNRARATLNMQPIA
jgi:transposase